MPIVKNTYIDYIRNKDFVGNTYIGGRRMKEYFTSVEVSKQFEKTKQWVHWAVNNVEGFPQPSVKVGQYPGWDKEEIAKYKADLEKKAEEAAKAKEAAENKETK